MQAIGLIETKGLVAATESTDAMLKAADVSLLEKTYVGGGLVSIVVTGDVGAVKAAVEAGGAAVRKLDERLLVSQHIIPRPHEEIKEIIVAEKAEQEKQKDSLIKEIPEINTKQEKIVTDEIKTARSESEEGIIKDVIVEEPKKKEFEDDNKDNLKDNVKTCVELDYNNLDNKEAVDKVLLEYGLEETIEALKKVTVIKLRSLAREYKDFGIKSAKISKANKKLLIGEFKKYYENK